MKYQFFSVAIASLALAACGGADTETETPSADTEITEEASVEAEVTPADDDMAMDASELRADCDILASDPEAQENFVEMGTDADGFCNCFVQVVEAKPDEERTQILVTLTDVTDDMQATGEGAEEAVSRMMSAAMVDAESDASKEMMAGVMMIGDIIDDIDNSMEDGGSCPAT